MKTYVCSDCIAACFSADEKLLENAHVDEEHFETKICINVDLA